MSSPCQCEEAKGLRARLSWHIAALKLADARNKALREELANLHDELSTLARTVGRMKATLEGE